MKSHLFTLSLAILFSTVALAVVALPSATVGEDTVAAISFRPSDLRLPLTLSPSRESSAVASLTGGFTVPAIQGTISGQPLVNLPPARVEHDGLYITGSIFVLGLLLIMGAGWFIQQARPRRTVQGNHGSLQHE